jgi:NADPH:quinone reductase
MARARQVIRIREPGGPDVLQMETAPLPALAPHEALIEVRAAGINRPDISQRLGKYPVPPDADPVPGLEVAGVVAELGVDVKSFVLGERVFGLTHGGGYATLCKVDARHILSLPRELSFVQAAALPEVAFTVEFNMMMRAGLRGDECVLIHGGSSGIGSYAIQRAKAEGARVITSAGSQEKCDFCRTIGADLAINYKAEDWPSHVAAFTNGRGVDVVVDIVAGDYVQKNIDCLAPDGRYALISLQGGRTMHLDIEPIMRRRLTLTGSTLRPLSADRKAMIAQRLSERVIPLIRAKKIAPAIYRAFPLAQASEAHRLMETGRHLGKIVLEIDANEP